MSATTTTTTTTTTTATTTTAPTLDLADIQGNILRGYGRGDGDRPGFGRARHYALAMTDGGAARAFIGLLVSGDATLLPQITTAAPWPTTPTACLNLGVTSAGLKALGVPADVMAAFPPAFLAGSAVRSAARDLTDPNDVGLGDVGNSAPVNWVLGGVSTPTVHLLLSVYVDVKDPNRQRDLDTVLRTAFADHALTLVSAHDAVALPHGRVHFGYVDGLSQPFVAGSEGRRRPDMQPDAATGDFLLGKGYVNIYGGNFAERLPAVIADNGSYGVFRIIRQDVAGFEELLDRTATRHTLDPELVAAKLVGRWRSGAPLVVAPAADRRVPLGHINDYDYAPGPGHETYFDDAEGVRCPVGAHMRRLNPRGAVNMGVQHNRRIIRRGIAYGPEFAPKLPDDGIERGLMGYFICGDIENQYEFIMSTWVNRDFATHGVRGTRDPILGVQPALGGGFTIRMNDSRDPIRIDDLPELTTTRGSLYCFLPGIGALRWLASLST